MKLQLQGQGVRLRVDEAELAQLLAGETVVNQTLLGSATGFSQSLLLGEDQAPALAVRDGGWQVTLPASAMAKYVETLPCRHALSFELDMGGGALLSLDFEVDVRDSMQARGPRRRQKAVE